jgi:hypothetical protein
LLHCVTFSCSLLLFTLKIRFF